MAGFVLRLIHDLHKNALGVDDGDVVGIGMAALDRIVVVVVAAAGAAAGEVSQMHGEQGVGSEGMIGLGVIQNVSDAVPGQVQDDVESYIGAIQRCKLPGFLVGPVAILIMLVPLVIL